MTNLWLQITKFRNIQNGEGRDRKSYQKLQDTGGLWETGDSGVSDFVTLIPETLTLLQ